MMGNVDWISLANSLSCDDCVLVLGPNTASLEINGSWVAMPVLLADHLSKKLMEINPTIQLLDKTNFANVAKQLEDTFLPLCNFSKEKARARLGEIIKAFYAKYDHTHFPVFEKLAKLPFRFVINTSPNHFLSEAYDDENKFSASQEFYHYLDLSHNNKVQVNEEDIRSNAPLVYNLFGSIQRPDSMIITEKDQLAFLDAILQKENKASIPSNIAIQFTSAKGVRFEKIFVFIGFDFNQWHLRLLMHLIGRYQQQKETYALQDPKDISDLVNFFYKRNFNVQFIDNDPLKFAEELNKQFQTQQLPMKAAPKLKVFLMFDREDNDAKARLQSQLAPLSRSEIIEAWDEEQLSAGSERKTEIAKYLNRADIIILLVTASFFASDEIYENQLQTALQRHENREAVVIPILMESCLWESSNIGKLATILPRNRKALNEQLNPEATLADTVMQIEKICQKIYARKLKNSPHRL